MLSSASWALIQREQVKKYVREGNDYAASMDRGYLRLVWQTGRQFHYTQHSVYMLWYVCVWVYVCICECMFGDGSGDLFVISK